MADISALLELVQFLTDLAPIVIIIIAILFVLGLAFDMLPTRSRLAKGLRIDKKMIIATLAITSFLFLGLATTPGHGAVAMKVESVVTFGGLTETVKVTGLTVDTEYTIWATNNAETFNNVTWVASKSTMFVPIPSIDDSDGYTLNIATSTAGAAAAATATLYRSPRDIADFLQISFFFNALVPILLIVIVVGLLVSVRDSFKSGTGESGRGS